MSGTTFIICIFNLAKAMSGQIVSGRMFANFNIDPDDVATDATSTLYLEIQNNPKYVHVPTLDPEGDEIKPILYTFCYYAACTLRQQIGRDGVRKSDVDVHQLPSPEDGDNAAREEEKQAQWEQIREVCSDREWHVLKTLRDCDGNYPLAADQLGITQSAISKVIGRVRDRIAGG